MWPTECSWDGLSVGASLNSPNVERHISQPPGDDLDLLNNTPAMHFVFFFRKKSQSFLQPKKETAISGCCFGGSIAVSA